MPLIVKNQISSAVTEQPVPTKEKKRIDIANLIIKDKTVEPVASVKDKAPNSVISREVKQDPTIKSIKEPSVVVDGKVKKISKKSAFLLDMLSLDD